MTIVVAAIGHNSSSSTLLTEGLFRSSRALGQCNGDCDSTLSFLVVFSASFFLFPRRHARVTRCCDDGVRLEPRRGLAGFYQHQPTRSLDSHHRTKATMS